MIQKWIKTGERLIDSFRIFDVSMVKRRHDLMNKESEFVVINSPDWVNIIPITKTGEIVLVRQYRHGSDSITLEIPGGMVDRDEDHAAAAARECIEETGYEGRELEYIGETMPNPAFMTNTCYSYHWKDCELKYPQKLDTHEDIEIVTYPFEKVKKLIMEKKIQNSLVLTAFLFFSIKYKL